MRTSAPRCSILVAALALATTQCGKDSSGPRVLAPPSALAAVAVSARAINLTWTDNSGTETGFRVERCAGVGCTDFAEITTVAANATTYASTALTPGTAYGYRVRAYDANGNSTYSNAASTTTAIADFFVNKATGNDLNSGTSASPFKTITKGLSMADSGKIVKVAPGRYDATNGETFPLVVRTGVVLLGDEANKGGGASPTEIWGGGPPPGNASVGASITPGAYSVIAGFTIRDSAAISNPIALYVQNHAITIRNNRIINSDIGIYLINGSMKVDSENRRTKLASVMAPVRLSVKA